MVTPLDFQVARAVTQAHLLEMVLHGRGEWTMDLDGLAVDAWRAVDDYAAAVEAVFPEHCWLDGATSRSLSLRYNGEVVAVREIPAPGDGSFTVSWSFSVEAIEHAA